MTTTDSTNPFEAPTARLEDYSQTQKASLLLAEARVVSAGAAWRWLGTGWVMFRDAPASWIGILLLYLFISVVASLVPGVNVIVVVLSPVFGAGLMLACEAQRRGSTPKVAHLFEGFRRNVGQLVLIAVIYMTAMLVVVFTLIVVGGGIAASSSFLMPGGNNPAATATAIGIVVPLGLAALVLIIPLSLSFYWSPALVVLHDVRASEAMKSSLSACFRNWRALLVYAVLAIVLSLIATIPLGLGLFVAGPVLVISWWAGYRDIFVE